jgi:RNA polymerase sigma factor (sigma-70 family)
MARGPFSPFLRSLEVVRRSADSDAQLLGRFIADRDEAAFAELVRRHGSLVWGVCRQVLGHDQDAEDAFQATFLLLARRARTVRDGGAVASWLHGTAWRVAVKSLRAAAVRVARERRVSPRPPGDVVAEVALRELQSILHEEVARLPAKCRVPFVLCVLEGRGRVEVARELGWNEGTLSTRLADARKRLRTRLLRRGIDVAAAMCAVEVAREAAPAAVVMATVSGAIRGSVSPAVAGLIQGGIGAMFVRKLQRLTALGLFTAALTAGAMGLGWSGHPAASQTGPVDKPTASPADPERPYTSITVQGRVIGPDHRSVAGVTVYLVADGGSEPNIVWKTHTDDRGNYEFRTVPVPLASVEGVKGRTVQLQVCGAAPELGFAWNPRFAVETVVKVPPVGTEHEFIAAILQQPQPQPPPRNELLFSKPEAFAGRVLDDQGKPVAGANVRVTDGDWLRKLWNSGDTTFWFISALPPSVTTAVTDADGRFRIAGVPHNFLARLAVTHPAYAELELYAATTDLPGAGTWRDFAAPDPGPANPIWTGEIDLTLVPPRTIPVRVVSDKTGEPLRDSYVKLYQYGKARVNSSAKTDADGRVVLRAPPGAYKLDVHRWPDQTYQRRSDNVTITPAPAEQSRRVRLVPWCTVEIEAIDVETGLPARGVRFEQEGERPGTWDALDGSSLGMQVRSVGDGAGTPTDKWGKLTMKVRPGKRVIRPHGQFTAVGATESVELPAGETVKLQVKVRERQK